MARQLRLAYPRAIYHGMNRGDRRKAIFTDDAERQRFLDCFGEACAKTQWPVHPFCLQPNLFHLVLETPRTNLVADMKWVLGTWANVARRLYEAKSYLKRRGRPFTLRPLFYNFRNYRVRILFFCGQLSIYPLRSPKKRQGNLPCFGRAPSRLGTRTICSAIWPLVFSSVS